jgi:two-component system CheB/CheR fusion protein
MPPDSGMAFVVIQHLDPDHKSHMADLLAKHTRMKVAEAGDGLSVEPNAVYVLPPNKHLTIQGRTLHLGPIRRDGMRMPIDLFLRSLAEDLQDQAVGVILSGSGSDGSLGVRAVRGAGGMVMVQDPATAVFDNMPRSAIATGLVDYILPVDQMPEALLAYMRQHRSRGEDGPAGALEQGSGDVDAVLNLLLRRANSDFRGYKRSTIVRRVERRMSLNQIEGLPGYLRLLQDSPEEVTKLAKEMLIGVTGFFRDPEAFEELRRTVIAPLVQDRGDDLPLRVWVPGCATGEEAYSVAILLLEELRAAQKPDHLQAFASDIDEGALAFARAGIYPESVAGDLSSERLERFFVKHDGGYQVAKAVRESLVFTSHNLITAPPFSKLDLISCRNVLIYLEPEVQERVISLFGFALNVGGCLLLGRSESTAEHSKLFEALSKKWRIYRRTAHPHHLVADFTAVGAGKLARGGVDRKREGTPASGLALLPQQLLLDQFSASLLLIDAQGTIRYFYGQLDRYLTHPSGEPDLNLFAMARGKLSRRLRTAVRQALEQHRPVRIEGVAIDGSSLAANVTIRPFVRPGGTDKLLAVIFEDVPAAASAAAVSVETDSSKGALLVEQLETELATAKAELEATTEEFETANEELKAAHEEAMSMNEELQSTNEELEASKEELQSVNEELTTLNTQLTDTTDEVTAANNDLSNLIGSTDIATIFLDRELRIKRFTPPATELLNLIPSDVGKPVGHIQQSFRGLVLADEAQKVLKDMSTTEREVSTDDGRWYLARVLPYRTADNRIDGVVTTFSEVTQLKQTEASLENARAYAESIVETIREPLLVLDAELRAVSANAAFYKTFKVKPADTEGRPFYELGGRQFDIPALRQLLEDVIPDNSQVMDFEVEHEFPGIGRRSMLLNARRVEQAGDRPQLILLAMEDVTERRRAYEELAQAHRRLQWLIDSIPVPVSVAEDPECRRITQNPASRAAIEADLGGEASPLVPGAEWEVYRHSHHGRLLEPSELPLQRAVSENREIRGVELEVEPHGGQPRMVRVDAAPVHDASGTVVGGIAVTTDITEDKRLLQAERARAETARLLEIVLDHVYSGVAHLDADFGFLQVNPQYEKATGHSAQGLVGRSFFEVFPSEKLCADFSWVRETGRLGFYLEYPFEFHDQPERGITYWDWVLVPVKGDDGRLVSYVLSVTEVTDKVRQRERLVEDERARAKAAENVAAEVSHRMKNNLAILSGLLELQLRGHTGDDAAARGLRNAISRVSSLSAVHEQLYETRSDRVELKDLLRRIGEQVAAGLAPGTTEFAVSGSVVHVSSKVGTALAIVASELITNAIKHGAPGGDGILRIKVGVQRRSGKLRISVWNPGNPLPRDFDVAKQRGMGLLLAREIVTGQLGGSFALRARGGGTAGEIVLDESIADVAGAQVDG